MPNNSPRNIKNKNIKNKNIKNKNIKSNNKSKKVVVKKDGDNKPARNKKDSLTPKFPSKETDSLSPRANEVLREELSSVHPKFEENASKYVRVKRKKKPGKNVLMHPAIRSSRKKREIDTAEVLRRREERRKKHQQALELRMSGATYQDIANALGYTHPNAARKAVESCLTSVEVEAAKHVVLMDLKRLDEFQMRCTHALRNNEDLSQIDRILRIMEWRYKLLGVNDETVRVIQQGHGIATKETTNNVMVVNAAPETEKDYVSKMMRAVGVNPESEGAQKLLNEYETAQSKGKPRALPIPEGASGEVDTSESVVLDSEDIGEDVVLGEIVEPPTFE